MGGITRCVSCGEVHWNLRLSRAEHVQQCRLCGAELRAERRPAGGRFDRLKPDRREVPRPADAARLGPGAAS